MATNLKGGPVANTSLLESSWKAADLRWLARGRNAMNIDGRAHPTIAIAAERRGTTTAVRCTGAWTVHGLAQLEHQLDALSWPDGELVVDGSAMSALDTSGAWLLHRTIRALEQGGRKIGLQGLRPEFSSLLRLIGSREVAAQAPAVAMPGPVARLGQRVWSDAIGMTGYLSFVGESFTVLVRSLAHPRRIRWRPILHNLQSAGFEALPITGLLSFLLGIVIAYQGADQLQRFGANIFIADLVGSPWCANSRRCSRRSSSPAAPVPLTPRRSAP